MNEPTLDTRWLMRLQGSIPQPALVSPTLMVFNVLDARIESPRIRARMASPSGDWVRVQPNGNWKLDVRLLMIGDDEEPIYCEYSGILRMDAGLGARIAAGESIPGDQMYFRSAPYFETSSKKYAWLNDIVCVGKMASFGGGDVRYDIFEVL